MPQISPATLLIFAEMDALNRTLLVIDDNTGTPEEARELVRSAAEAKGLPEDVEGYIVLTAMWRILGKAPGALPQTPIPVERHLAEAVGLAWAAWMAGRDISPTLAQLGPMLDTSEAVGAMHAMALKLWLQALEAGKTGEGRRLWKRALEVSSSFGSESHPMLQWAYAATWLPETPKTPTP